MDTVDDELDQIKDSIGRLNPRESKAQDSTRWDQGRFRDHDRWADMLTRVIVSDWRSEIEGERRRRYQDKKKGGKEKKRKKQGRTWRKRGWTWEWEGLKRNSCWMTAAEELTKRPVTIARRVIQGIWESSSRGIWEAAWPSLADKECSEGADSIWSCPSVLLLRRLLVGFERGESDRDGQSTEARSVS